MIPMELAEIHARNERKNSDTVNARIKATLRERPNVKRIKFPSGMHEGGLWVTEKQTDENGKDFFPNLQGERIYADT